MISRSTFYQHFSDKYAIIEQIEEEYIEKFKSVIEKNAIWNGENRTYNQINESFKSFFVSNNNYLRLLNDIDDVNLNLTFKLKKILSNYISKRVSFLNDLEVKILAAQAAEYFVYYIYYPDKLDDLASSTFKGQIDMILCVFGITNNENNRKRLKDTLVDMMNI